MVKKFLIQIYLLSDAVRERKDFNPIGSKQFFRVLATINMPKDFVRNDERWRQVQLDISSGEDDILYTSPQRKSRSGFLSTSKRHIDTIKSKLSEKPRWHIY